MYAKIDGRVLCQLREHWRNVGITAGRLESELRAAMVFDALTIRVRKMKPPLAGALDFAAIEIHRS